MSSDGAQEESSRPSALPRLVAAIVIFDAQVITLAGFATLSAGVIALLELGFGGPTPFIRVMTAIVVSAGVVLFVTAGINAMVVLRWWIGSMTVAILEGAGIAISIWGAIAYWNDPSIDRGSSIATIAIALSTGGSVLGLLYWPTLAGIMRRARAAPQSR